MTQITIRNLEEDRETVVASFYPSLEAPDPNRSIRQVSDKQTLLALLTEWDDMERVWLFWSDVGGRVLTRPVPRTGRAAWH
jgi:hypothetical protein